MGAPVRIGDVLAKKYKITKILGVGGMGVVVAAHHCELDKLVALKFMHEEVSSNKQITERFLREAQAAARLQNEHVAHVLDVGRLPNGVPYIVMEHLEGQDLGQVIESQGPLDVADAAEYVLQACEAMAEAHAQGIIHRDLKPQNLFLTTRQDGRRLVKVLDFGISKAQFSRSPTSTSQTMGSPSYMAPEQIRSSRSVDARADIWSLGVILYQLLSNALPFGGDTVPEVIFKVLSQPAPRLALIRSGVPASLLNAIDRCLEKERERRFANVAELAHELVPFTPGRARAAISLIERVMTAGVQQPRSAMADAEFAMLVPSGAATTDVSPKPPFSASLQTTLGTAASSISIDGRLRPSRWRSIVITAAAIVAISIVVTRSAALSRPEAAPVSTAAAAAEAHVVVDACVIDCRPDTPFDALLAAPVGALPVVLIDASTDASIGAPVDIVPTPHIKPTTRRHAVPPKTAIDPDREPTPPNAQILEPALTDDVPTPPAN